MAIRLPSEDDGIAIVIRRARETADNQRGVRESGSNRPGESSAVLAQISHIGTGSSGAVQQAIDFLDFRRGLKFAERFERAEYGDCAFHLRIAITRRVVEYLIGAEEVGETDREVLMRILVDLYRVFPIRSKTEDENAYLERSLCEARNYVPVLAIYLRMLTAVGASLTALYANELLSALNETGSADIETLFS